MPMENYASHIALTFGGWMEAGQTILAHTPGAYDCGNMLSIHVGVSPDGSLDLFVRLADRHIGSRTAGHSQLVVKNRAEPGGLRAPYRTFELDAPRRGSPITHVTGAKMPARPEFAFRATRKENEFVRKQKSSTRPFLHDRLMAPGSRYSHF